MYHAKLIGFDHNLKSHRPCSTDNVESTAGISLPFQVQSNVF